MDKFERVRSTLNAIGLMEHYWDHFQNQQMDDETVVMCLYDPQLSGELEKVIPVLAHQIKFKRQFWKPVNVSHHAQANFPPPQNHSQPSFYQADLEYQTENQDSWDSDSDNEQTYNKTGNNYYPSPPPSISSSSSKAHRQSQDRRKKKNSDTSTTAPTKKPSSVSFLRVFERLVEEKTKELNKQTANLSAVQQALTDVHRQLNIKHQNSSNIYDLPMSRPTDSFYGQHHNQTSNSPYPTATSQSVQPYGMITQFDARGEPKPSLSMPEHIYGSKKSDSLQKRLSTTIISILNEIPTLKFQINNIEVGISKIELKMKAHKLEFRFQKEGNLEYAELRGSFHEREKYENSKVEAKNLSDEAILEELIQLYLELESQFRELIPSTKRILAVANECAQEARDLGVVVIVLDFMAVQQQPPQAALPVPNSPFPTSFYPSQLSHHKSTKFTAGANSLLFLNSFRQ